MFIECVYFCLRCGCLSLKESSNCSSWFIQAKVRGAELKARDCNGVIILWQWIFVYHFLEEVVVHFQLSATVDSDFNIPSQ